MERINSESLSANRALPAKDIRDRLTEAMNKRRELAALLCEIRNDICYCLELRRLSSDDFEKIRKNARSKSPKAAQYMDDLYDGTKGISLEKLRRAFVEAQFLSDSRVVEPTRSTKQFTSPRIWLSGRPECGNCGLPILPGRRKFCSDACAKEYGEKPAQMDGGVQRRGLDEAGRDAGSEVVCEESNGRPTPQPGPGDRNLACDYYDNCLDLAAFEEWESFHCESCGLKDMHRAAHPGLSER